MISMQRGRVALFAGSFDPFTKGHAALVERALALFDHVVIGIGNNITKNCLLSIDMRRALIADYYSSEERVSVAIYSGMTGDFAREIGAKALVRGVRSAADFELERTMDRVNSELYPDIHTLLLITPAEVSHISSSCVRELLAFGQRVDQLLPGGVDLDKYRE